HHVEEVLALDGDLFGGAAAEGEVVAPVGRGGGPDGVGVDVHADDLPGGPGQQVAAVALAAGDVEDALSGHGAGGGHGGVAVLVGEVGPVHGRGEGCGGPCHVRVTPGIEAEGGEGRAGRFAIRQRR